MQMRWLSHPDTQFSDLYQYESLVAPRKEGTLPKWIQCHRKVPPLWRFYRGGGEAYFDTTA